MAEMQSVHSSSLVKLLNIRILVAFLGEKNQYAWWTSSFLGATGAAVLAHPFPKTSILAQYHGAIEAARKVHDEFIGVGQVLHLFRVSEEAEQDLHALALGMDATQMHGLTASKEAALAELSTFADMGRASQVGPILLGPPIALLTDRGLAQIATSYAMAFQEGHRSFPYFKAVG